MKMNKKSVLAALFSTIVAVSFSASADERYEYSQKWMPKQEAPLDLTNAAIFFTDPQNGFYSEDSPIADLVQPLIKNNNTVKHQQELLRAARSVGMKVFYSPHMYTMNDYKNWDKEALNGIDRVMFNNKLFIEGTKSHDWYPPLAPDKDTIIMNPHKGLSNFQTGDANIQLRMHGIDTLIMGGMAANMCVESHARDAIEHGFKVIIVSDATAAAGQMAQDAAYTNYEFIGNEVVTTSEIINRIKER
ncbi:cysteine hydrolase [Vibrio jasicida]|uniref:cysteine hydrolase n=1 Tax=Vibrio jasicida TaxID=766224 RepID=UPI0003A74FA5|nr:cysteine hydrolase [Vibrio jasicida]